METCSTDPELLVSEANLWKLSIMLSSKMSHEDPLVGPHPLSPHHMAAQQQMGQSWSRADAGSGCGWYGPVMTIVNKHAESGVGLSKQHCKRACHRAYTVGRTKAVHVMRINKISSQPVWGQDHEAQAWRCPWFWKVSLRKEFLNSEQTQERTSL